MATSSLQNMLDLVQLFTGKGNSTSSTESGGTTTKQTVLSQEAMNGMLKSALEGNSGLASVASGQNAAGLYNSSTNTMLTNDLLSRLSTQVAVAGAPTLTTTPVTTKQAVVQTPKVGASGVLGLVGASAGKNVIDKFLGAKKTSLDSAGDVLGNSASQSTDSIAAMAGEGSQATADFLASTVADSGTNVAASGAQELTSALVAPVADAFSSAAGDAIAGALSSGVGAAMDSGIDTVASSALTDSITSNAGNAVEEVATSFCFLTTAVCEYQGKADDCYELEALRKFRDTWLTQNHPESIEEYYAHAPALVAKIKAYGPERAAKIFKRMYTSYILPAVESIELGENKAAYFTYRQLYNFCVEV